MSRVKLTAKLTAVTLALTGAWLTSSPAANAYTKNGRIYVEFVNQNAPDKCLGITGGDMNNGNSAVLWTCYNDPVNHKDQYWTAVGDTPVTNSGGSTVHFHTYHNLVNYNKCLGVSGASMRQGTAIVIWDCNNSKDQWWAWGAAGNTGTLANLNPFYYNNGQYMVVGVPGAATGNGAALVLWDYQSGHPDQIWNEQP